MEEGSEKFDIVVASEVVEHVANVEKFIKCFGEVLKVSLKNDKVDLSAIFFTIKIGFFAFRFLLTLVAHCSKVIYSDYLD